MKNHVPKNANPRLPKQTEEEAADFRLQEENIRQLRVEAAISKAGVRELLKPSDFDNIYNPDSRTTRILSQVLSIAAAKEKTAEDLAEVIYSAPKKSPRRPRVAR